MKKGFTLIELLIVVAIIAILAAIAIPNFLQAQTRAKVSRAQADMRSIATALESYYVDHNAYPPDGSHDIPNLLGTRYFLNYTLTTPIAYMSTADLKDPFFGNAEGWSPSHFTVMPWLSNFRYTNYVQIYRENEPAFSRYSRIYGLWALYSRGPVGVFSFGNSILADEFGTLWTSAVPYDPTNGTVSAGDIMRCQLGPSPNFGPVIWQ